jgi:3-oxoacyl-[acyl-carrier protein] reductase
MGDLGFDYSGCHVVVTGGTQGAGLKIARGFRDFGAIVTVTGRQYLTSYYDADLTHFRYAQLDLADPDSIVSVAESVGPVDVLVNAAGSGVTSSRDSDREFIIQATQLGLIGPVQLATRLRFRLAKSTIHGGGSVIYAPATQQWFSLTHAEGAQAEMAKVTRRLGTTWGRHGIRVNAIVAPAVIPAQARGLQVQIAAHSGPLLTRASSVPVRAQPDVTELALFLGSRGAATLTGQTLAVR